MTKITTTVTTELIWTDDVDDTYLLRHCTGEESSTLSMNYNQDIAFQNKDIPTLRRALGKILKL